MRMLLIKPIKGEDMYVESDYLPKVGEKIIIHSVIYLVTFIAWEVARNGCDEMLKIIPNVHCNILGKA